MEFNEFREKFNVSQDRLHKLTLEALDLLNYCENEMEEYEIDPDDYEYEAGSARDEYLYGFLRLLMEPEDDQ